MNTASKITTQKDFENCVHIKNAAAVSSSSLHRPKVNQKLNIIFVVVHCIFFPNSQAQIEWRRWRRVREKWRVEFWKSKRKKELNACFHSPKVRERETQKYKIYDSCSVNETIFIIIPRDSSHDEYLWNVNGSLYACILFFFCTQHVRRHTYSPSLQWIDLDRTGWLAGWLTGINSFHSQCRRRDSDLHAKKSFDLMEFWLVT